MKKSKKFLKVLSATAIAAIMATSMVSTTAFAVDRTLLSGTQSLTVNVGTAGAGTYKAYKVADVYKVGNAAYAYEYTTNFTGKTGLPTIDQAVTYKTAEQISPYANKLVSIAETITDDTAIVSGTLDLAQPVAPGYYLVLAQPTDNKYVVSPTLVLVTETSAVANAKASEIKFDKSIESISKEGTVADGNNAGVAEEGAVVKFNLKANVPSYADGVTLSQKFTIEDTLEKGKFTDVDYKNMTVTVDETELTEGEDGQYTLTGNDNDGFTITFDDTWTLANGGKEVNVTFDATLGENPDVNANSNDNTGKVTFANNFATGGLVGDKPGEFEETVKVYTTELKVYKYATEEGTEKVLEGAVFELYKGTDTTDDNKITEGTTNANGVLTFDKTLDVGKYTIKEKTPPVGYQNCQDVVVEITATSEDNTTYKFSYSNADTDGTVKIENTKGQTLPGTGGVGTTMFTIGGISLVVVAGAMLTIYMKKRKATEE